MRPLLAGTRTLKIVNEMGSSTLSGMSPYGQHAASSIRDAREREKKEMSDLNDRLANYIEKVSMNLITTIHAILHPFMHFDLVVFKARF